MAKETKFSEEELKQINEVADGYSSLQTELGNLGVQRILVEERLQNINDREEQIRKEWKQNQVKEQDLVKILSEKYGPGTLDPKTGNFIPLEENKPA